jgi:undecaprenyl-diphosphatase
MAFPVRATRLPWWGSHLLAVGVFALGVGLMVAVSSLVTSRQEVAEVDRRILAAFAAVRRPWLNTVAVDLTALGSLTLIAFFTLGGLALLLTAGDRRGTAQLLAASVGTAVLIELLKALVERPRPQGDRLVEAFGYSYPSGHSLASAAVYLTLALVGARHFRAPVYRRTLVILAIVTTGAVALSRVYLGVHYATDIVAGTAVGVGWALLVASLFAFAEERGSPAGS